MELIPVQEVFFERLFSFESENRKWFEEWVPPRPDDYFEYERFVSYGKRLIEEMEAGEGLYFIGFDQGEIVGRFNLTFVESNIVDIGYRVALKHIGKGYAHRFSMLLIEKAKVSGVEKITAEALIENGASTKVLRKLGFELVSNETQIVKLGTKEFSLVPYQLLLTKQ